MKFIPKILNDGKSSNLKSIDRIRKPKVVIPMFVSDSIIKEIIENRKENLIPSTFALNKSILLTIKHSENYELIIERTKFLREYLIQPRKLRIFYYSGYQILIVFTKKIRTIQVFHLATLIAEGEVDMTILEV